MILLLLSQTFVGEEVVSSRFLEEIERIEKPLYAISSGDTVLDRLYRERKFDRILRKYATADRPIVKFVVGEAYYYRGDYAKADSIYSKVYREDTGSLREMALLSKGWIYYKRGLYDNALRMAEEVEDTSLDYPAGLLKALAYIAKKDYASAFSSLKDYETPEALLVKGYSTYMLGNYDLALEALNRLYELYPENRLAPYALFRIATIYLKTGYSDDAVRYLSIILDEYPQFELRPQAYFILAKTLFNERRYEELADVVERYFDEYPRGDYVETMKRYLLQAYLQEPYLFDENYRYYHFLEGYRNYTLGNCGSAIEHLERFLKSQERRYFIFFRRYSSDPLVPDAILYLAQCYARLGDTASAEKYLKKCNSPRCRIELANIYFDQGKYSKVISMLERYKDTQMPMKEKAKLYYLLGAAYARKGEVGKAKRYLKRAEILYKEVGGKEDIERIREELRNLGKLSQ